LLACGDFFQARGRPALDRFSDKARHEPILVVVREGALGVLPADPLAERSPVRVVRAPAVCPERGLGGAPIVLEPAAQENEVASVSSPLATAPRRAHEAALRTFSS
jgi:hypothetical protein